MKIFAIIASVLAAGAIAVTVAINIIGPDNTKAMEMQRKDIDAERKAITEFQKTHPNPFKVD